MSKPTILQGITDMASFAWSFRGTAKKVLQHAWQHKKAVLNQQAEHVTQQLELLGKTITDKQPTTETEITDRRFRDPRWQQPFYHWLQQSYQLASEQTQKTLDHLTTMEPKTLAQAKFMAKVTCDSLAPSNHPLLNPEVLNEVKATKGLCLKQGLTNAKTDLQQWRGYLNITKASFEHCTPGKNIANTPSDIVYENDIMQLLQYRPSTDEVTPTPLLMVTSWVNKYYILDLQRQHSFIRWAVAQGFTVFVINWVNPDERLAHKDISNYVLEGPIAALDHIQTLTQAEQVNVLGYCLGGTLLGITLAYLQAIGQSQRVASASFLASMFDFADAGPMQHLMGEDQLDFYARTMRKSGLWSGYRMSVAFNLIRMNENIWPFWIRHYLLGKPPSKLAALYWSQDVTNVPAPLHTFYLHQLYQQNTLVQTTPIKINNVDVQLQAISQPCFFLGFEDDTISPWSSCFVSSQVIASNSQFILAPGGHFSGIVSAPDSRRGHYWQLTTAKEIAEPKAWREHAQRVDDTWQHAWCEWLKRTT